jgi:hypothetical protein
MAQDFTASFPTLPSLLSLSLSPSHIRRCLFPCACGVFFLLTVSLFSQYPLALCVRFVRFCGFCEPFLCVLMGLWAILVHFYGFCVAFFLTFFFCILKCTCMSFCVFYAVVCAFFVRLCILLCVLVYVCTFMLFCALFCMFLYPYVYMYILLYNFMLVCVFLYHYMYL